jgi:hypothetical protein
MTDLTEIVARALRKGGFKADERDAADLIDALRNPPASVIEAGARAAYDAEWGHGCFDSDSTSESEKEVARGLFIASWQAALNA